MKHRPIAGVELKSVRRYQPQFYGAKKGHTLMVRKPKGGYMPYTDYCINSSRLINKIYELENRIVNLKRLGLRLSKKK